MHPLEQEHLYIDSKKVIRFLLLLRQLPPAQQVILLIYGKLKHAHSPYIVKFKKNKKTYFGIHT